MVTALPERRQASITPEFSNTYTEKILPNNPSHPDVQAVTTLRFEGINLRTKIEKVQEKNGQERTHLKVYGDSNSVGIYSEVLARIRMDWPAYLQIKRAAEGSKSVLPNCAYCPDLAEKGVIPRLEALYKSRSGSTLQEGEEALTPLEVQILIDPHVRKILRKISSQKERPRIPESDNIRQFILDPDVVAAAAQLHTR